MLPRESWHVKLDHCRSCDAPIIWTVTTNGKRMPVDADAHIASRGFQLDEDEDPPVARFVAAPVVGATLHQSHFATCPNADQHRRTA